VKGKPNQATADVRALAGQYGEDAIRTLAQIMKSGETESARISAAKELLDRAYGKAAQPVGGGDGTEPIKHLFGWLSENSGS